MSTRAIISFLFLTIILGFNCKQENKTIEGDLYFSWVRFGSFYNQPDSLINAFKIYADSVNRETIPADAKWILTMYETLKKEDLLKSPFIDLRLDNDSVIKLYLDKEDYDKIRIHGLQELQDNNKKVRIKAEVRELGNRMMFCKELISVNKVDGQTLQVEKKFKIENYR